MSENVYRDSRRRRAERQAKWRRVAHLRQAMSDEELAEEEKRLRDSIESSIANGAVILCPTGPYVNYHEIVIHNR